MSIVIGSVEFFTALFKVFLSVEFFFFLRDRNVCVTITVINCIIILYSTLHFSRSSFCLSLWVRGKGERGEWEINGDLEKNTGELILQWTES